MALPYLPDAGEIPARRFVLMADSENRVMKFDESVQQAAGEDFDAVWESPSLNRGDPSYLWTLTGVDLLYAAEEDTTVQVEASPDGGETYLNLREVELSGGTAEEHIQHVQLRVTGDDIRVRVTFNTNFVVNLLAYRPWLKRRGRVMHSE